MREPAFWWRKPGLASGLLSPLAGAYGAIARRRLARAGARAGVPVLCVGNFTLGGTGKTPLVMALAKMLIEGGERVFCLSRGYGGSARRPKAGGRPCRSRRASRRRGAAAGARGADDRLRATASPARRWRKRKAPASSSWMTACRMRRLQKDLTIAVIDGRRGIGNGLRVSRRALACAAQRPARAHRRAAGRGRAVPAPSPRAARAIAAVPWPAGARCGRRRGTKGAQGPGLCRHRRSGQVFRYRHRRRHRGRRAPRLSPIITAIPAKKPPNSSWRPSTTASRCSPPRRTAPA